MKSITLLLLPMALTACVSSHDSLPLESGINTANFSTRIQHQDDFYESVNGSWLAKTEIPADKSNYGAFTELLDGSQKDLRSIIETAASNPDKEPGSETQKVGDFYRSYMNEALAEQHGMTPLATALANIDAIDTKDKLSHHFAELLKLGVATPVVMFVDQDARKSDEYIVYFHQSGLGLPDRDYYFKPEQKFADIRSKYLSYIADILTLTGDDTAESHAKNIFALETALAKHHWTRVKNRDRNLTNNKYKISALPELMPHFAWSGFIDTAGLGQQRDVIIRQPSYLQALDQIWQETPLATWKHYLRFKLTSHYAPLLHQTAVDTQFKFYGSVLGGIETNKPRWKRAVSAVDNILGESVGKLYVAQHFKPQAKARMEVLVSNLIRAFGQNIDQLDWMSDETKKEAHAKLANFTTKIGYPDKWKDYTGLHIDKEKLVENVMNSHRYEYQREIYKLGKPVDRSEWFMTPQTVNAYYNPPMNEIVFPAAILQPPFFNMSADDAANYGGIGAVIGHEISHGFDDQGRKSDGNGNLRDWWTEADTREFNARAQVIIDQYAAYSPIEGMQVNGKLTLGENIADVAGLTVAYKAYLLSLNGKQPPVIDGLTGAERFFMGWSQVWRRKYREQNLQQRLLTDPHSPSRYRVIGVVANIPAFYETFNVNPDDDMYIPPEHRVKIW